MVLIHVLHSKDNFFLLQLLKISNNIRSDAIIYEAMLRQSLRKTEYFLRYKNNFFIFSLGILITSFLIWWLAYYPGTMSPDSILHWKEATSFRFSNASPYLYSLIFALLAKIYNTPAVMGLLQLGTLSLVISLFLSYALKKGASLKLLLGVLAFFIISPIYGIYNVTIWKDVLYAYLVIASMLLTFILISDPSYFKTKKPLFVLAGLLALISLLRFNGLIFFVAIPIALFLCKTIKTKELIAVIASGVTAYLLFTVLLFKLLNVTPAPLMKEGIYVKLAGSLYVNYPSTLTKSQAEIFNQVIPGEKWKQLYMCIEVDPLYQRGMIENGVLPKAINEGNKDFVNKWHNAVLSGLLRNPKALIKDKVCLANYLFGIRNTHYKYESGIYSNEEEGLVVAQSKFPWAKQFLNNYLRIASAGDYGTWEAKGLSKNPFWVGLNYLVWSAIVPIIIFLSYLLLAIKNKNQGTIVFILVMLCNLVVTLLLVPASSFRYVYVLFVAWPFLPILYILEGSKLKK